MPLQFYIKLDTDQKTEKHVNMQLKQEIVKFK